jgi:hypothetical protein
MTSSSDDTPSVWHPVVTIDQLTVVGRRSVRRPAGSLETLEELDAPLEVRAAPLPVFTSTRWRQGDPPLPPARRWWLARTNKRTNCSCQGSASPATGTTSTPIPTSPNVFQTTAADRFGRPFKVALAIGQSRRSRATVSVATFDARHSQPTTLPPKRAGYSAIDQITERRLRPGSVAWCHRGLMASAGDTPTDSQPASTEPNTWSANMEAGRLA